VTSDWCKTLSKCGWRILTFVLETNRKTDRCSTFTLSVQI